MMKYVTWRVAVAITGLGSAATVGCLGHTTLGDSSGGGSGGDEAVAGTQAHTGGSGEIGGYGGSWATGGYAGTSYAGSGYAGGGDSGGYAGSGYAGSGHSGGYSGGGPLACPASLVFDGSPPGLALGPLNHGLLTPTLVSGPVENYQGSVVFDSGALASGGAFDAESSTPDLGPADGDGLEPYLGQISLIPPDCQGTDVTGRTVTVRFLVDLTAAIVSRPTNGAFLGSMRRGAFTYYEDAVTDGDIINTLAGQTLTHTFTRAEAADVKKSGLFLNLFALSPVPITLYVDEVVWE